MSLQGKIMGINELNQSHRSKLYQLMNAFYDDITPEAFSRDLEKKDHCILLLDQKGIIQGFSTQMILDVHVNGKPVSGVFSGDTIIHPDYWGSIELFKTFTRQYIAGRKGSDALYWFLISKGYKTYKMLPLFFNEFYPNFRKTTPVFEQDVMHAFGKSLYPEDYDPGTGVIQYKGLTDKLKPGLADASTRRHKDRDVAFFLEANPGHAQGNDLVCLTRLAEDNLNRTAQRLLLGKEHSHE